MRRKLSIAAMLLIAATVAWTAGQDEEATEAATLAEAPAVRILNYDWYQFNQGAVDLKDNPWSERIFEVTGVRPEFTFIPAAGYNDQLRLMVAANEDFDIFVGGSPAGLFDIQPFTVLNDLLDRHGQAILNTATQKALDSVTVQGEILGVPIPEYRIVKQVPLIRRDWLDMLGMDMPSTIDEFEEFLRAVRETDMDGNGELDEYGLTFDKNFQDTLVFDGAFGVPFWYEESYEVLWDEREIRFWSVQESAREFYQTISRWYQDGLIDPESLSQDRGATQQKFGSGKAGIMRDSIGMAGVEQDIREATGQEAIVEPMPPLRGIARNGYMNNPAADRVWYVFRGSDKAEEAVKFLNYFATPEGSVFGRTGIEGVDHEVQGGVVVMKPLDERRDGLQHSISPFALLSEEDWWDFRKPNLINDYEKYLDPQEALARAEEEIQFQQTFNADYGYKGYNDDWQGQFDISKLQAVRQHPDWLGPHREYRLKFLTGTLDAGSDEDWDAYVQAMEIAGLFDVLNEASEKFFTEVYDENPTEFAKYE